MRYFIEFSYNGTNYFGYQIQPKQISVQEVLEKGLSTLLRQEIKTVGAGRTDTGVHAAQMFAHFNYEDIIPDNFVRKLNSFLPPDISISHIFSVPDAAHARFDAIKRTYQYSISIKKNPFKQEFSAQFLYYDLDIEKMNQASEFLFKYIDFTSFSKTHTDNKTNNCKINYAKWEKKTDELIFMISADRFLRNMVRAITGTLIDVGREKLSVIDFCKIIEKKDRKLASTSAPAKGLTLLKVEYPSDILNPTTFI